jgi:hypothetical protein
MSEFQNLGGILSAPGPMLLPGIALRTAEQTVPALGTYTPDLRQAVEHNISCQGDITLANPLAFLAVGFAPILITHIRNISGGAITVTFGTKYKQAAFTNPTDGIGVVSLWHYDASADLWFSSARQTVPNA